MKKLQKWIGGPLVLSSQLACAGLSLGSLPGSDKATEAGHAVQKALAPKEEAISAMGWALSYCSDALKDEKPIELVPELYQKYQVRRDNAIAADPSIKDWDGEAQGRKVSEWLPRCETEISAKLAKSGSEREILVAVDAALIQCAVAKSGVQDTRKLTENVRLYKEKRAQAVTVNKGEHFTVKSSRAKDVDAALKRCDAELAQDLSDFKEHDALTEARREQEEKERQAKAEKSRREEKALVSSLKGDRRAIYEKYGRPHTWRGDITTTAVWTWVETERNGSFEADCTTTVRFNKDKVVSDKSTGLGCRLNR